MTTTTLRYDVRPIALEVLTELRTLDDGGAPLRCCLRRSTGGESIALVSYAPLRRWAGETGADPGPYDEVGPVYIHAEPCAGPDGDGLPLSLLDGRRVLRSYCADGSILGGRLIDAGDDVEQLIAETFADGAVALVHIRFAEFGCFLLESRRP
jgi:hypothetical protein